VFWLLSYHIFLIYNYKTTYEHYRNKFGPNLFFNRKTFFNIFKILFRKVPQSFLKLQETIFFTQNSPNSQIKQEKTEARIPIKTIEEDKKREEIIKENDIDDLFLKQGVILEDIPDDYMDKIHVFSDNLSRGKNDLHSPLPAKNNFLEIEVNKYNKEVFKKKNSFEISPQTTMKQNKSYVIEKENGDVSFEKKNFSTILCNKEEPFCQENSKIVSKISKSIENLDDFKGIIIDKSFKTVKSDNNVI